MTISIEHSMPTDLAPEDLSQFGVYRPGNIITEFETGLRRSRSYSEYNLALYNLRIVPKSYTEETYEALMALMNSTAVDAIPFWIKEPISKPRIAVPGEIADGTSTTYILPLDTGAPVVTIGGELNYNPVLNIHSSANELTDIQANGVGGLTTGLDTYGTCTISAIRGPGLDGEFVFYVLVSSSQANVGIHTGDQADWVTVSPSNYHTVMASFMPTDAAHTYRVEGQYKTSGGANSGSTFFTSSTGTVGTWLHLRATAVSLSDAAYLQIRAYRTTDDTDGFMVACLGVAGGDFKRWFLPSLSPRLIEWTSTAPSANKRLTFSGPSCKRWARVVLSRNQQMAAIELLGDTSVQQMNLSEVMFT